MLPALRPACCVALLWALAACSGGPTPAPSPSPGPTATSSATSSTAASSSAGPTGLPGCRLPAPVKSDDACSTDADCGVSEPCHARACVARAKSHPPGHDTMCTQMLQCGTADANRCGCLEGRCALIPPS